MTKLLVVVVCLLAAPVHSWLPVRAVRSVGRRSSALTPLEAKPVPKAPLSPEPKNEGIEPKYLAALGVFLAACVFDFFRMHGGVAPWQEGGFL